MVLAVITTLVLLTIALVAVMVRRVARMECYRDAVTGELWEPRFLIVMYQGPAHLGSDGRIYHGSDDGHLDDDEKERAFWWGNLLVTARAYRAYMEETPFMGERYECNWCRSYDLRQVPKRRREVMYAMASMLVDMCREADAPACAQIIGERDARPLEVNRFSDFIDYSDGFMRVANGVLFLLAHANIPELVNKETVLHRLLTRRIAPNEFLDGLRWEVGDPRRAA